MTLTRKRHRVPKDEKLIGIDEYTKLLKDQKRAGVLICDTTCDQRLQYLIHLSFSRRDKEVKKLFEPSIGGPLVSLTHKARLAYALGIIDKTFLKDLEQIHKIRNEFAHGLDTSFASTEVLKHTQKLSTAKGHKVTTTNSYKIFFSAMEKCLGCFHKSRTQEVYRQAMLAKQKKSKQ